MQGNVNLLKDGLAKGLIEKTELTKKINIEGSVQVYPVYKIRLDSLYYNDKNDRIATWISKYKSENDDFNELSIIEYNDLIQTFIEDSNPSAIQKTKTNIELIGQQESGVILNDGRIVDGNRRFTCLRTLKKSNANNTNWFEAIILPENISQDGKRIKLLELAIQHGEDGKVDYNPVDRLVGIYNDIIENKLLTIKEYAQITNETETEIKKKVALSELMVEYLDYIGASKQFYVARENDIDGPLNEIYNLLKKCSDDNKEDYKNICFTWLVKKPNKDMTRYIRSIKNDVINTSSEEEFINEQIEVAQKVSETLISLEEEKDIGITERISRLRSDEGIKTAIVNSREKAVEKTKREQIRNQPLDLLSKAISFIEEINEDIISEKLNTSQINEIKKSLSILEDKIIKIRACCGED